MAELTDVLIEDCSGDGVAVIGSSGFVLQGDATSIRRAEGGAGVILRGARDASLRGGRIGETVLTTGWNSTNTFLVGDGVAVVRSVGTSMTDVSLEDNGRIGLFVDGCSDPRSLPVLDGVRVTGTGEQRGAYARVALPLGASEAPPAGWDRGITRLGSTAVTDAMGAPLPPYETTDCPP